MPPGRLVDFIVHQADYAVDMGIDLIRQTSKSQPENGATFFVSAQRTLPSTLRAVVVGGQEAGELRADLPADYIADYLLRFSRGMI